MALLVVENCPESQSIQAEDALEPEPEAYDPAEHGTHDVFWCAAPSTVEYCPGSQSVHPDDDARPEFEE